MPGGWVPGVTGGQATQNKHTDARQPTQAMKIRRNKNTAQPTVSKGMQCFKYKTQRQRSRFRRCNTANCEAITFFDAALCDCLNIFF